MNSDYPTKSDLRFIRKFDLLKNPPYKLLDHLAEIWHWGPPYFQLTGKRVFRLELHTGGWSGNEDIIQALKENFLFWHLYWRKSEVGGHFYFRIRPLKRSKKK